MARFLELPRINAYYSNAKVNSASSASHSSAYQKKSHKYSSSSHGKSSTLDTYLQDTQPHESFAAGFGSKRETAETLAQWNAQWAASGQQK